MAKWGTRSLNFEGSFEFKFPHMVGGRLGAHEWAGSGVVGEIKRARLYDAEATTVLYARDACSPAARDHSLRFLPPEA